MSNLSHTASLDISNYVSGINKMRKETSSFSESVVQQSEKIDESLRKFGTGIAAYFTIDYAKNFVNQLIRVRGEFQQLEIGLNTMLGSKAKADALMAQLVEFATKTPFELTQISSAAKQLIAYGTASEDVIDILRRLGDISSGLSIPLGDLSYLFGTTMVQGRLYAQDMMQFSNRGIPLISELAKQFNVSTSEVKELVSQGKVGFPEVEKAIKSMTDTGGRFAGLTERNAGALTGLYSNLEDAISNALNEVGEQNEETLADIIKFGISAVENYKSIAKAIGLVVAAVGSYKAAIMLTAVYQKAVVAAGNIKAWLSLAKGIKSSKDAMLAFNLACKANPIVLIVSLLSTAVSAFLMFRDSTKEAAEELSSLEKIQKATAEEYDKQASKVDSLTSILNDENAALTAKKEALTDLKGIIPGYNASLDEEGRLIDSNTTKIKDYLVALEKQIQLKAAQEELEELYRRKRTQERDIKDKEAAYTASKDFVIPKGALREDVAVLYDQQQRNEKNALDALNQSKQGLTEIEGEITRVRTEIETTSQAIDDANSKNNQSTLTYTEQLKTAQDNVVRLRQEIADLRSGKTISSNYAKDIEEKLKQLKEEEGKIATLTGKKVETSTKSYVDEYAREVAEADFSSSLKSTIVGFQNDITQAEIDALEDGFDKKLRQLKFNYQREQEEIVRQKANLLKVLQERERETWEQQNPDFKEKGLQFTPTITTLPEEYSTYISNLLSASDKKYVKDQQDLLNSVLQSLQSFNDQRANLEREYNATQQFLLSQRSAENAAQIDSAIAIAKQKYEQGLQEINDAEASAVGSNNEFIKNLFGDYATLGFDQLSKLVDQAKLVRDYLSGKGDASQINFISKEQLDLITKSPAELAKLKKALDSILGQGKYGSSNLGKIISSFEESITKLKGAKNFKDVSGAIGDIAGSAANAAGQISEMFESMGQDKAAAAASAAEQALTSISNIGKGFAQGGLIGGIAAAVGEAAGYLAKAFAAAARHKAALAQITKEATAQQREYNIALLEQQLLLEHQNTIFGTDGYGKASEALNIYKNVLKDLNKEIKGTYEQSRKFARENSILEHFFGISDPQAALKQLYAGLADIEVKTGHRKTGLFGWGKGEDVYSSILNVYPELISASGEFNKELAQTILNTREMSEEDKEALQYMIDLAEKAEEAFQQLNDYMTSIFGELGSTMMDTLVEAFKSGEDAAEEFYDSVSEMLENLAKQMIYSVTLGPLLQKAQDDMMAIMQNSGLTDEQKFKSWTNILSNLVDDAVSQQDLANRLMSEYQNAAEQAGFDLFKDSDDTEQAATSRGFSTISQETGEQLEGRFTAIQITTANILSTILEMHALLIIQVNHLSVIERYTKRLSEIEELLVKIESNTANL